MKKLGQKTGAIGALLFALIPAFFMAACSTDAADDTSAVTAALNAEKAKYETAINLKDEEVDTDVTGEVIKLITGQTAGNGITLSISQGTSGLVGFSEAGGLTIQKVDGQAEKTVSDGYDNEGDASAIAWQRETQVVTLKFEKDGVTSYLDVLAGFGDRTTVTSTWLGYGYNPFLGAATKPVLDLKKQNAAGWIKTDSKTEELKITDPRALARLAAQGFIDDVVSGMSDGQLQAVYGDSLIVKAPVKSEKFENPEVISIFELIDTVKAKYARPEMQDTYRRAVARASEWVSEISLSAFNRPVTHDVRDGWFNIGWTLTVEECLKTSGNFGNATDMNQNAGGKYLYGVFQTTSDPKKAIEDFVIVYEGDSVPSGYKRYPGSLNESVSNKNIFIYYKPANKDTKTAVKWLAAEARGGSITSHTPAQVYKALNQANMGALQWVSKEPNGGSDNKKPADANKNHWYSSYVYLTQEKADFTGQWKE